MATIANPRGDRDRTTSASASSLQSSQTTVFGAASAAAATTVAEVEFNSMPPDATLLPNVEVTSLYMNSP